MIARINDTQFPFDEAAELEPILIDVIVGDQQNWSGKMAFEIDSGSDIVSIPLPVWLKLFGQPPVTKQAATVETADGSKSQVDEAEIALRIETTDKEVVTVEKVSCVIPVGGTPLLGRNILQLFSLTICQNKVMALRFNPKAKTWLSLVD